MNATAPAPIWLVLLTAFVSFLSILLHVVAPRTKTTIDDRASSLVDRFLSWLRKLSPLTVMAVVAFAAVTVASVACGHAGSTAQNAIHDAPKIDCTVLDGSKSEIAKGAIVHVLAEHPGDWTSAAQAAAAYGAALGGCELAKLVQQALTTRGTVPEQWGASQALEQFRTDVAGGATFHTEQGEL